MMAPSLFSHLRARGIPVWFLGVNNEADLHLAVEAGDLHIFISDCYHDTSPMLNASPNHISNIYTKLLRLYPNHLVPHPHLPPHVGATAVLTDRVNWAVNHVKTNKLRFRQIAQR